MRWILACWVVVISGVGAGAEEPSISSIVQGEAVRLPTLGGMQFWADLRWHDGWRVQHNPLLSTCRVLDSDDRMVAWGSREACLQRLEESVGDRPACPPQAEVVVLLHGLMSFRHTMVGLGRRLDDAGYTVVNLSYPSTQGSVGEHAASLAGVIDHLRAEGCGRIHFVAHSLGNLIVRRYFHDRAAQVGSSGAAAAGFGRMVMLAPPNRGARLARFKGVDVLFQTVGGIPARQLSWNWDELERELATPPLEFGILAGGLENATGFNPLLPGDDDGTVAIEETRLAGASDFAIVKINHSGIMLHPKAREYTLRFLREGRFREDGPAEPIVDQSPVRGPSTAAKDAPP